MFPDWLLHVIGTGGAICVLLAYFLVSNGKVTSSSVPFQLINLVGAALLTTYALMLQGWSLVFLNGIWALIAIVALIRIARRRRTSTA